MIQTVRVPLKKEVDDSYQIVIGSHLQTALLDDLPTGPVSTVRQFAIITDETVKLLYAQKICERLRQAGYKAELLSFPAGEAHKTRETKAMLEDKMFALGFRRDCCILAIGGGVVTDLAGFLAGTYCRGVPFISYSTTFLGAADAAIGGKTGVDTDFATNAIGLFYQPKQVYIDVAAWKTLPKAEISCGLAETIKHACLFNSELFAYLEEHMDALFLCEEEPCLYIAAENCRLKQAVVTQDEKETDYRSVLNLGHTVGRAIETVSNYRLRHGEAVSLGLLAAYRLSASLGFCTWGDAQRVESLLRKAALPTRLPTEIDREAVRSKLYSDKKVKDGQLRFVLPRGIGQVMRFADGRYTTSVSEQTVREILCTL